MDFAILRTTKLRAAGNVAASAAHILRARPTANADPRRAARNHFEGPATAADVLARVHELASTAEGRDKGPERVLAIEYLVTASPEAFHGAGPLAADKGRRYLAEAIAWIRKRHVEGTVVLAAQHYDETSPHAQVIVVPLVQVKEHNRKRNVRAAGGGRQVIEVPVPAHVALSARHYLGGRARLGRMQTEFAKQVAEPLGLRRGVEGSQAKHTTISTFYGAIKRAAKRLAGGIAIPMPTWADLLAQKLTGGETENMRKIRGALADRTVLEQVSLATAPQLRGQAQALNARKVAIDRREVELAERDQADKAAEAMRRQTARNSAVALKAAYSRAQLFTAMGMPVPPTKKADVFDLLVQAKQARDFAHAVELVSAQCPLESGDQWAATAQQIESNEAADVPPAGSAPPGAAGPATSTPRPRAGS